MSYGSGTLPSALYCVWALNGITTWQSNSCCGESTTTQLSITVRPVSTPPLRLMPFPNRVLKLTPTKFDVPQFRPLGRPPVRLATEPKSPQVTPALEL